METVAWPFALVGLPLWLGPPLLLIIMVTRAGVVRIGFGAGLVAALTLLYLSVCQLLQGPGLPIWIEGLLLWGPTTLAVCGAAVLTDRWFTRRRDSDAAFRIRYGRCRTHSTPADGSVAGSGVHRLVGVLRRVRVEPGRRVHGSAFGFADA
jgi:hypothetical protein